MNDPTPQASPVETRNAEAQAVAAEFPGWEGWWDPGVRSSTPWHARLTGATPPIMVRGETRGDLRDEIIKCIRRREMAAGR